MDAVDRKTIEADLFGGLHIHFSEKQRQDIVDLFLRKLSETPPPDYRELVIDFHRSRYWGFSGSRQKPLEPPKSPSASRQIAVYFWTAFQALIVLKVIIYFFGLRVAQDNTLENWVYLIVAVAFSWTSLFFFAWRKHRDPTWKNQEPPQGS
ncbi:MAG: hypothetical protein LW875_04430 [Proteobacteria bacterium]|jgi:fatty acid desaturase|nr:hypothetical protein [Pseudomonadota bacterium]